MKNKKYKNIFIEKVIVSSLNENSDIINEILIYENFLDSIKTYLQNRYDDTLADLSNNLKTGKEAAIVIKEIIKNEDYLDKTLTQLNKLNRSNLKQLKFILTELSNNSPDQLKDTLNLLNSLVSVVIQKSSYFYTIRGWKGFLASLGNYTIIRYLLNKIFETKDNINQLAVLFSSQNIQDFEQKINNFFTAMGKIASYTMSQFLNIFMDMGDIFKIMTEVLSQIKRKLSISPSSLILQSESIMNKYNNYKNNIFEIEDIEIPRTKFIPQEYNYWSKMLEENGYKKLGKLFDFDLYYVYDELYDYVVLLDHKNKRTVMELKLTQYDMFDKNFYVVLMIKGNPLYAGKDYAVHIYTTLIKKGYNIISDSKQSTGGKKIWRNLVKQPEIYVYAFMKKPNGEYIYSDIDSDDDIDDIYASFDVYFSQMLQKIKDKIEEIDEFLILVSKDIKDLYAANQDEKALELEEKYDLYLSKKEEYQQKYDDFIQDVYERTKSQNIRMAAIKEKLQ
jgi:hypothetical protein